MFKGGDILEITAEKLVYEGDAIAKIDGFPIFVEGACPEDKLKEADIKLTEIGYLNRQDTEANIVLFEFSLPNRAGSITQVLELTCEFGFNISYISAQDSSTGYQTLKMGLYVDDVNSTTEFIERAEEICPVRVIDYNQSEKIIDNSIFYTTFVSSIARTIEKVELECYANIRAMSPTKYAIFRFYRQDGSIYEKSDVEVHRPGRSFLSPSPCRSRPVTAF